MKYLYPIFFLLVFFLAGCSSQNNLARYENTVIAFGNGGGFSGEEIEYQIKPNRIITSTNSLTKETKEIGKISKSKAVDLYTKLDALKLPLVNFNYPGNMYYFIKQKNGDNISKVVWGDYQNEVPKEIKIYYDELISIVEMKSK